MKMTIRRKLLGSFLIVVLLLVFMGGYAVMKLDAMGAKSREIDEVWLPSVAYLGNINTAISDVDRLLARLVLEPDAEKIAEIEQRVHEATARVEKTRALYEPLITRDEERAAYERLVMEWDSYLTQLSVVIQAGKANEFELGNRLLRDVAGNFARADEQIEQLMELNVRGANDISQQVVETNENARQMLLLVSIVAVLVGVIIAFLTGTSLSKAILRVCQQIKQVAGGDLTAEPIDLKRKDELGELATDANRMIHSLRQLMGQVMLNAEQVAATSEELTASAEQTSRATEQIAESVGDVAAGADKQLLTTDTSYRQVSGIAGHLAGITGRVQLVSRTSQETSDRANGGQVVIGQTMEQMDVIHGQVRQSADVINELGMKSKEIGEIITMITTIANQTNLLALNAAIEAARAGEHGRGFSVVADEVRKLAEQSGQAADQISKLVSEMQGDTDRAIHVMHAGTAAVDQGLTLMRQAGDSFADIVLAVDQVTSQVQEVSAAIEEINGSSRQVVEGIEAISVVSRQSSAMTQDMAASVEETNASMEEIAAAAETLASMAEELQQSVSAFKI